MKIILTPQLEELLRQKVASGLYATASEVVAEALRLMEVRDQLIEEEFAQLRFEIQHGVEEGAGLPPRVPEEIQPAARAKRSPKAGNAGK